ncbi:MAG: hypothetical protein EB127_08420 [Alphaproteobacteria bacterium]|nr:hypothetical protein [Alphaproteobacteria bacterium]
MINRSNFMGLDGFAWWFGIVENRKDPLSLGRCQVRIFGWHSEDKNLIPTKDLPWAHPILPITSNSATLTSTKEGDMVFGFFLDSDDAQFPVMLGIVPGIPEFTPKIDKGFSDQRGPVELASSPAKVKAKAYSNDGSGVSFISENAKRYPNESALNESTISRLARNEEVEGTFIGERKLTTVKNVYTGSDTLWSEPETKYNAKYPFNHVYESESGHIMEMDDTPGSERIHLAHRSGTFDEIYPDGSRVTKVVNKKYEIVMSDDNVYIMGDCNITINGNGAVYVRGDADLKVGGSMSTSVQGTYEVVSTGNMTFVAPRIDFNPIGRTPIYIDIPYLIETAVIQKRQVPGGSGTFSYGGVTLEVSPDYSAKSNDYVQFDAPQNTETANTEQTPPVTCGDFSEPLTEEDYNKNISTNYKLRDLSIACLYPYRINAQKGLSESQIACNLQAVAQNVLEPLRAQYPGFRVNSGYRVGEGQSQHGTGQAVDIQWTSKNKTQLLEIAEWASKNLKFDQLIYEIPSNSNAGWLHISFNRNGNRAAGTPKKVATWKGTGYTDGLIA